MNEADKSIDRRARATKFEVVQFYDTATTVKSFGSLTPGMYKVAAEGAEIYVIDGSPSTFDPKTWSRIEAGDYEYWESRSSNDVLSCYLSAGASIRITRRCAG